MGRYDDNDKLIKISIAFRGTSGQRDALISDAIGDVIHDLLTSISPEFSNSYAYKAFGKLLQNVADLAKLNGLSGKDIIVSGHSLGGMAVNSMAKLSSTTWSGFFSDSRYVAIASPTQYEEGGKVLNIGYENDPVFRVLYGNKFTPDTLGIHNTFLFVGHFGQDIIHGFNIKDKLIFIGIENGTGHDYHDFISQIDNNIVFDFGHSSVILVDTSMSILMQAKIILA